MAVKKRPCELIGHAQKDIGKDHAAPASNTTLLVQGIDVFQSQQPLGALTLHAQRKNARNERIHSSKYTRYGAGSSALAAICRERRVGSTRRAPRSLCAAADRVDAASQRTLVL